MNARQRAIVIAGIVIVAVGATGGTVDAQTTIPDWVKDVAGFWAEGLIDDATYTSSIQYLIQQGIITMPEPEPDQCSPLKEIDKTILFEVTALGLATIAMTENELTEEDWDYMDYLIGEGIYTVYDEHLTKSSENPELAKQCYESLSHSEKKALDSPINISIIITSIAEEYRSK